MTISLRGYDAMLATPPDEHDEPDEESMQDQLTDDRLKELERWLQLATATEVRMARALLKRREEALERDAKETLAELGRVTRVRRDKGKPRMPKGAPANETERDVDPFEVAR